MTFFPISCRDVYSGCKNMPEQTIGTGEIIMNALVWYSNLDLSTIELINSNSKNNQIIASDSENIFGLVVSFDNGESFQPIDFSQYTVFGKYADGSCRVIFEKNITKKVEQKKYIYKITVIQCGFCEKLVTSMNWVLIPKIEDDFIVEFVVEK